MSKPDSPVPSESPLPPRWSRSDRFVPRVLVQPVARVLRFETAGGVVMLVAAAAAIVLANSPVADTYFAFWDSTVEVSFGGLRLAHLSELTVREWVNDGLMAVFFFVVALEIKREFTVGDLSNLRTAALPVVAAVGGMVVPAAVYVLLAGQSTPEGWAIPMATDVAFALGFLALAGRRVPLSAKLFLLTMAIADDLGAIAVIALFFTDEFSVEWMVVGAVAFLFGLLAQRAGAQAVSVYAVVGGVLWVAFLESGIHATVAGVALAVLVPVRSHFDPSRFGTRARALVDQVDELLPAGGEPAVRLDPDEIERGQSLLSEIERLSRGTLPPLHRVEFALGPIAAFVIVPIFAFANAGLAWPATLADVSTTVFFGVAFGLLVGKVVGITAFTWLAIRLRLASLPPDMTLRHVFGLSTLAAVGFTVALFVTSLTFISGSPAATGAKLGIFGASIVAGIAGVLWLRLIPRSSASHH